MTGFLNKRTAIVELFKAGNSKRKFVQTWIAHCVIRDTCKSFPKRLQLVINAKGGHIE